MEELAASYELTNEKTKQWERHPVEEGEGQVKRGRRGSCI